MEPITREEYYLAKIAGTWQGKTPEPVTIEEYYLATMAGDYSGNTPQPVTRLQYYMAKAAGVWGGSIPAPVTRLEYYWAAIANGEGTVFQPVTREEHLLALVADAYSVVITVVTGNPAMLEGVKGSRFTSLTLHGKSSQGSTTGAQLLNTKELITGYYDNSGGIVILDLRLSAPKIHIPTGTTKISISGLADNISALYVVENAEGAVIERNVGYKKQHTISINPESKTIGVSFYNDDNIRITADMLSSCMINFGDIKPYEPYTGGAPSPSPSYPQEIENAGDKGQVDISILGANLAFGNKSGTANDAVAYLYGLQKFYIKAKRLSGTSQVNCRFHYENGMTGDDIYILTKGESRNEVIRAVDAKYPVKHIAIYAVGVSGDNPITELEYLMVNPENIPYEPYKPAQTLIIPTPGGLPGIPVSSGGNYTDKDGQQWVCDEIDLANGEKVQRCKRDMFILRKSNNRYIAEGILGVSTNYSNVICDKFAYNPNANNGSPGIRSSGNYNSIVAWCENFEEASSTIEVDVTYVLATPIRTPLPPETIAAYKSLKTYSPTTTVINDAGAGMIVGYKKAK